MSQILIFLGKSISFRSADFYAYFSGPGGRTGRTFSQKVRINVQGGQSASQGIALLRATSDGIAWTFMRTLPQKVHTIVQSESRIERYER